MGRVALDQSEKTLFMFRQSHSHWYVKGGARTGRPIKETIAKSQGRNRFLVVSNRKSNSYLY